MRGIPYWVYDRASRRYSVGMLLQFSRLNFFRAAALACAVVGVAMAPTMVLRFTIILTVLFALAALTIAWRRTTAIERRLSGLKKTDATLPLDQGNVTLEEIVESIAEQLDATTRISRHLESVLNGMADAVFIVDAEGEIRESNATATRLLGWTAESLQGRALVSLLSPEQRLEFSLGRAASESRDYVIETADGAVLPVSITGSALPDSTNLIFVLHDITERRKAERRINYLAKHDGLTRLPNRMQFQHLLQQAIARSQRQNSSLALLYLDVDRFKDVNDTFGHSAGDRALEVLSERLAKLVPAEAVVGRLAGDEFAVFMPVSGRGDRPLLSALARDLLSEISKAFFLNGSEIYLTVSIGIALAEPPADHTIALIRCADVAMYHAKQGGGGTYAFFDPSMSTKVVERLVLKNKLRRSLELDELVTLYQPIVELESGRIVGAEALLRWRLPGYGDIPPSEFIPLAEQSNLIHSIGEWVFRRVCTDFAVWRSAGLAPQRVSINLSPRQFGRSSTVDRIATILDEYGVSPSTFELEITESTLMEYDRSGPALEALAALGFRIAIDDFGTGYSSLSALRQMPVRSIKIDKSFLHNLGKRGDDATLLRTIIEMGRNLGLEVIAEGLETEEQRNFVAGQGCHLGQGLLFGAPMPAEEFQARLAASPAQETTVLQFPA